MNTKSEIQDYSLKFQYMFLGRLKMDLDYYLGFGGFNPKHLYYQSIDEHMSEIRKILAAFPDELKPEWFTENDLQDYEKRIKSRNIIQ